MEQNSSSLWNGDAIISTDGSIWDENGTYGVVILINLYLPEPTVAVQLSGHLPPLAQFLDMGSH